MKHLFTLILLGFSYLNFAQVSPPAFKVTGTVTDKTDKSPVELAAVVLKTMDSTYVADVFVDKYGKFTLPKVSKGSYYLEVNFLSYQKYSSAKIDVIDNLDLGTIALEKNTNNIKEVNVVAIKNAVEFKAGKTVYTVGRDATNTGLNGLEVLKKIPGVFIDNNDKISVRGKSGIRIFIDDRPSAMAAENPADAIRFFPAGSIESIEVITNPSARYDAAGAAAIINVKLKKEKKMGFNGNANAGVGSKYEFSGVNKYNAGFNGNLRRNKTNIFLNATARMDGRYSYNENNRENTYTGFKVNTVATGNNAFANGFGKAGIDYFINDKHTFGMSLLFGGNNSNNENESHSKSSVPSYLFPDSYSKSLSRGHLNSYTLNLNHLWKTSHAGEEISFDFTQGIYDRSNLDSINFTYYIPAPFYEHQYNNLRADVSNNTSQVDYSRTLKGDAKIEAGLKNTYTSNKSNFNLFVLNNEWAFDSLRSNRFDYFENISAAYAIYSNKYKKWDYEAGLRAEYTMINSNLNEVKQNYINLFPSLQASKKFEQDRELSFSYSRRIDRPPFNMLSNAISYADRYVGQRGNPKLKPEISNGVSIDLQKSAFESEKDFKLTAIGVSVFGNLDRNATEYRVIVDSNITYTSFGNVPTSYGYGINTYTQLSYQRWYTSTISLNADYRHVSKTSNGVLYNAYMQHNFKFLKKHSIDINGFYFSRFLTSQGYVKGTYQINVGYRYIFHKENATLSFNLYDVFRTGRYRYYVNTPGFALSGVFQSETRFANLSFTYKFTKGWQGDGKRRTKKRNDDSRINYNNGGGGLGSGK